jgi:hypothetical protein
MSAPVEYRLKLLTGAVEVFDRIDSTSRGDRDPGRSPGQIRAQIQTEFILARALEEMGDSRAAIARTEKAELQAKTLGGQSSNREDQLLVAEAVCEKARAFGKAGDAAAAMNTVNEAFSRLSSLENAGGWPSNSEALVQTLLCDSLVLKVFMMGRAVSPDDALRFLNEAVARGERAYQLTPEDPEVVDSYASSLEALGILQIDSGNVAEVQPHGLPAMLPSSFVLSEPWGVGAVCFTALIQPTKKQSSLTNPLRSYEGCGQPTLTMSIKSKILSWA